ncbi:MAG: putative LPS assembly protein LptD [Bacteroidota bacterium]
MTLTPHNKVVLFFGLLISFGVNTLWGQTPQGDTLKKSGNDSISRPAESEDELEEQVKYSAQDSIVSEPSTGKAILYGKAWVTYGEMRIDAEFIEIDYTKNLIIAYGKKDSLGKNVGTPVFKEGAEEMNAEKIMYNLKTKKGKIFNALTKQGELLVIGKEIKKDSSNVIYMKDMQCIPCQEADARTIFRATKAKIIPDDKIVTGPMYLEIGGVPTPLGLPFGYFPNTNRQHSGILIPTFGNSAERGFNLRQGGFYWGINDKTDMIIRGDIYANGSWALNTSNNYNVLYKARGSVNLGFSQFNIGDKDIPAQFSKERAYEVGWVHQQDNKSNPSIQFGANVNIKNNQTYNRLNAVNSGQYLTNTFQSNVNFTKAYKLSSLSLNATHSQNTNTKQVDITFPSLTFNVNRFFPFKRANAVRPNVFDKIGVSYLLTAQNTLSGHEDSLFKVNPELNNNLLSSLENKMRYGIKHSVPISTNFNVLKYVTVTPGLNLSAFMYTRSTHKEFVNYFVPPRDTLPGKDSSYVRNSIKKGFVGGYDANFSTAFSTKVYFDYVFRKGKVKQIRHLLIPTLTYVYRPDFGKEQYGFWKQVQTDITGRTARYSIFENNIYGGPGIGEQNSLAINLNNTFDAKVKQKTDTGLVYNKIALLQNISLSTAYNFAADSFKMSLIGVTARTVLFKNFDISAASTFDPYGYSRIRGKRMAAFAYQYNDVPLRFTNAYFTVGTTFSSDKLQAARKLRKPPDMTNGAEKGATNDLNPNESLPWNINLTYNLSLTNEDFTKIQTVQTINTTADIMPTKFWKLGVTTGFDCTNQKLSYTSFNITRDLKCWEARISWVPFGFNKSYMFTLNLKTSMLSDFKIPKQSKSLDNPQLQELFR